MNTFPSRACANVKNIKKKSGEELAQLLEANLGIRDILCKIDEKYPLTSKNSPPILPPDRKRCLVNRKRLINLSLSASPLAQTV